MTGERINGTVGELLGRFYRVDTDGPYSYALMFLLPSQMAGAKTGDHVVLEYQTDRNSGLWNVVEVKSGSVQ